MEKLEANGSLAEAADVARLAIRQGEVRLNSRMIGMLRKAGLEVEAEEQMRIAIEDDRFGGSIHELARFLEESDRSEEAANLRRYGIEPGGKTAAPWSASLPVVEGPAGPTAP